MGYNCWDITASGAVVSGETTRDGAHRELFEELGIDYDFSKIKPRFTMTFENDFGDFFIVQKDIDIDKLNLQKSEVQSVKWASLDDILGLIKSGEFIPYSENLIRFIFDLNKFSPYSIYNK